MTRSCRKSLPRQEGVALGATRVTQAGMLTGAACQREDTMRCASRRVWTVGAVVTALAAASAFAQERAPAKPNVVILATGGTIAGAQPKPGEIGYKAGAFPVDALIQAVPGMKDLASVTGEQI